MNPPVLTMLRSAHEIAFRVRSIRTDGDAAARLEHARAVGVLARADHTFRGMFAKKDFDEIEIHNAGRVVGVIKRPGAA